MAGLAEYRSYSSDLVADWLGLVMSVHAFKKLFSRCFARHTESCVGRRVRTPWCCQFRLVLPVGRNLFQISVSILLFLPEQQFFFFLQIQICRYLSYWRFYERWFDFFQRWCDVNFVRSFYVLICINLEWVIMKGSWYSVFTVLFYCVWLKMFSGNAFVMSISDYLDRDLRSCQNLMKDGLGYVLS